MANGITRKEAESSTFAALKENDVELINYIVEDSQLYNELEIGEEVIVTPKANEKGEYIVMKSYPPQIVAGEIRRQKD